MDCGSSSDSPGTFRSWVRPADGEQAVDLANRGSPDVLVMDIRMPRLDGIEATRRIVRIRKHSCGPSADPDYLRR